MNSVQVTENYAELLDEVLQNQKSLFWNINKQSDLQPKEALISAIKGFLSDRHKQLESFTDHELAEKIYNDLAEDSILTGPLKDIWVEKIRIRAWDHVLVSFINGQSVQISGFNSPQHAAEVINHLLEKEGLKAGQSIITGKLRNGDRITAIFPPDISNDVGVCCTIQKRRKRSFSVQDYTANGFASQKELNFLSLAVRYGLSILIVGPPESGKTAFLEHLLSTIPEADVIVLEQGFREIDAGQTILIPDDIPPADRLNRVMALDPDRIGFNLDSCIAQNAGLQGFPVLTSVCSCSPSGGLRVAAEQWRSQQNAMDAQTALELTGEIFPLIVTIHKYADHKRRISDISECSVTNGQILLKALWEFHVSSTQNGESGAVVRGSHQQISGCSDTLLQCMTINGITPEEIRIFDKEENDDVGRKSDRSTCSRPTTAGDSEE